MHKSKFDNPYTIDQAIDLIKQNVTIQYIWYPVINKHGCYMEIGGRFHNKQLEVTASIIGMKLITHKLNDYTKHKYSISLNGITTATANIWYDLTFDDLIKKLKSKKICTWEPKLKPIYVKKFSHYEISNNF